MKSDITIYDVRNDDSLRNAFIEKYTNFILSSASKVVGKFVGKDEDYFSIALIAFNEAITKFDEEKGDFFRFAQVIIKNRLIDELRKQDNKVVPFSSIKSSGAEDDSDDFDVEGQVDIVSDVVFEFEALKSELAVYNITLFDITKDTPKAHKTKEMVYNILMFVSGNESARKSIIKGKEIPVRLLMEELGVNRKLLERHRRYIIAATIILNGDYPIISEYIKNLKEVAK